MHNIKKALIESRWVFFVSASLLQLFILKRVFSYAVKDTWEFLMYFAYDYHQPIARVVVDVFGMWAHRMTNIALNHFWVAASANLCVVATLAGFFFTKTKKPSTNKGGTMAKTQIEIPEGFTETNFAGQGAHEKVPRIICVGCGAFIDGQSGEPTYEIALTKLLKQNSSWLSLHGSGCTCNIGA